MMVNQYGTKSWAKSALGNLDFVLALLEKPQKQWDKDVTHLEAAVKSLNGIKSELQDEIRKDKRK